MNEPTTLHEIIGQMLICVGLAFDLFGVIGLIRLPDIYNRLQAATKCVTLGTVTLLVGAAVWVGWSPLAVKAIICAIFILLTSPVGAHAIARGAHIFGVKLTEQSVGDAYKEDRRNRE